MNTCVSISWMVHVYILRAMISEFAFNTLCATTHWIPFKTRLLWLIQPRSPIIFFCHLRCLFTMCKSQTHCKPFYFFTVCWHWASIKIQCKRTHQLIVFRGFFFSFYFSYYRPLYITCFKRSFIMTSITKLLPAQLSGSIQFDNGAQVHQIN